MENRSSPHHTIFKSIQHCKIYELFWELWRPLFYKRCNIVQSDGKFPYQRYHYAEKKPQYGKPSVYRFQLRWEKIRYMERLLR